MQSGGGSVSVLVYGDRNSTVEMNGTLPQRQCNRPVSVHRQHRYMDEDEHIIECTSTLSGNEYPSCPFVE